MTRRTRWLVAGGFAVAIVLAFGASRYASPDPDGLEKVAADAEIHTGAAPHALADGPFAGYSTGGIDDPGLAAGLAGVVGMVVTFAIAGGVVWVASRASRSDPDRRRAAIDAPGNCPPGTA